MYKRQEQDTLRIGEEEFYNSGNDVSEMWYLNVVPIEDYNRLTQSNEVLKPGEAIAYSTAQDLDVYKRQGRNIVNNARNVYAVGDHVIMLN